MVKGFNLRRTLSPLYILFYIFIKILPFTTLRKKMAEQTYAFQQYFFYRKMLFLKTSWIVQDVNSSSHLKNNEFEFRYTVATRLYFDVEAQTRRKETTQI
jgi:hypothetical protein